MEQGNIDSPADVTSKHMAVVIHASLACLNKKRKLRAEQLGMPLPKHMCADQIFVTRHSSLVSNQDNEFETESGKGSNGFIDCVMSGEAKVDLEFLKAYPSSSNCPSASSANLGSSWSKDALYSLESRSMTKSDSHRTERTHVSKECDFVDQNFGWPHSLNYEDHLLDFESHVECSCSECGNENIETCTDKELEDMLYSNGITPDNFVLSSGRWEVGQDTQEGAKKLTIDKEFEQYFGMLML
ncbi:uncharacterized protein LOC116028375 [Ipomoea triloba]|uniref:uncharacterized protein LOC116028375 n=1 Tax=Ipomoea triloba TaxID=35885 RepID=UPI00125DE440|nr:uncharacterized protein LOC116028375 [Ipomoea triloba]